MKNELFAVRFISHKDDLIEDRFCAFHPQVGDGIEVTADEGEETVSCYEITHIVWDLSPECDDEHIADHPTAKMICYIEPCRGDWIPD